MAIAEVLLATSFPTTGIVSLILVVLFLFVLYQQTKSRQRAGDPPYVSGYLPFFGPIGDLTGDPNKFVREQQRKLGDVFFAVVFGKRFLFICNHRDVSEVWRQSNTLSFDAVKQAMLVKGMGPGGKEIQQRVGREMTEILKMHLLGQNLAELCGRFHDSVRALLDLPPLPGSNMFFYEQDVSEVSVGLNHTSWPGQGKTWHRLDLTAIMKFVTAAQISTFYGPNVCNRQLQEDVDVLGAQFKLLLRQMPEWLPLPKFQAVLAARRRIRACLALQELNDSASDLALARRDMVVEKAGLRVHKTYPDFTLILASTINSNQMNFWVLARLLTCPEALSAIKSEADQVLGPEGNFSTDTAVLKEQLQGLVKLNAFVNEVFRNHFKGTSNRIAVEDTELSFGGQTVRLKKGDMVLVNAEAIHLDKDVYGPDAEEFRWDRFLSDDKKSPRKFIDQETGRTASNHFMTFGGGTSACPGRQFACDEIKILTLTVLRFFDIALDEEGQRVPDQDMLNATGATRPLPGQSFWVKMRRRFQNE